MAVYSVTHKIVYGPQLRFGSYNIVWVTSRSINCHMALSAMNYLLTVTTFQTGTQHVMSTLRQLPTLHIVCNVIAALILRWVIVEFKTHRSKPSQRHNIADVSFLTREETHSTVYNKTSFSLTLIYTIFALNTALCDNVCYDKKSLMTFIVVWISTVPGKNH
jgi:hypothetical protein